MVESLSRSKKVSKEEKEKVIPEVTKSKIKSVVGGHAKVTCTYEIKMSLDFQSAGTTFGVELPVVNKKQAVLDGFARAAIICESMMDQKLRDVQAAVKHLSNTKNLIESGQLDPLSQGDGEEETEL